MELNYWLPVVWFGVIGFGVLMYVVLDGFVLGLGMLAPFARDEQEVDLMMNTAAPIWDGNETWLVLGGAGLFAAFPTAYAVILSGLYLPVLLMVMALVFRGVAFEFRFKAQRSRRLWTLSFIAGSILTAFAQGLILGALVEGMPLDNGRYTGGVFGWFSPFTILTGAALVFGYALLGSTWLILKTDGRTHTLARQLTKPLVGVVVTFVVLVSAWLPFLSSHVMARWFEHGNFWWLSPIPLMTAAVALALWRSSDSSRSDAWPFLLTLAIFVLGFIGLVLGMWPYLVPPSYTIWQAASPPSSQIFPMVGLVVLLPLVLGYTVWSYRVFRGKIAADVGYHHHH
ncbi:cytochrome d ubiquinol oxidase subunit II [Xanthomonas axonopodis]|uniref:cytochrome d ubiquinol oxidase subunit II n=1 Tax=Xanthomonas axonopodis TaxID=53413 RepID=UPI000EFFA151|nr:cytochrome d ubiquinol oxidase subunit II [Xanthomonas axonopodis]AYO94329.1 cytochrome d ubiquinol oxidase subunit II [Xanthomonas axonopodis pv. commiphoreae]